MEYCSSKPPVPLCRLYENESKKTGNRYLVGNLSFTTKLLGFRAQDEAGNPCWQLFVQERAAKNAGRPAQQTEDAGF